MYNDALEITAHSWSVIHRNSCVQTGPRVRHIISSKLCSLDFARDIGAQQELNGQSSIVKGVLHDFPSFTNVTFQKLHTRPINNLWRFLVGILDGDHCVSEQFDFVIGHNQKYVRLSSRWNWSGPCGPVRRTRNGCEVNSKQASLGDVRQCGRLPAGDSRFGSAAGYLTDFTATVFFSWDRISGATPN